LKKTHAIIFLAVFLCLLIGGKVFAADYKIEVPLPGLPSGSSISDPGQYVKYLFIFGLALAGFLAVAAIAYGGIKYMLSGTTITNVQDAKDLIYGALIGIGFLLGSYLLLYTIDPTLTNLSPRVPPVINISAPAAPTPGTQNCNPSCQTGYRCDPYRNYTCVKIEVTTPGMTGNQTPGQCQEFKTIPSGCAQGHKVWNPNTCMCEGCGDSYKWDYSTKSCVLK